ncbi:MAG: glycosyltransferase family 39 protein [Candidatus Omnitrophica bacterium]|nr:glycosyltransferase family 39 protein [Candidatus Omnitrophota bacterium]
MVKNDKLYFWLAWLGIALIYILFRVNLIDVPLFRDEGLFGYAGQVILDGGIPYRDVLDIKPPVVYYINAFALLFVPPTPAGIHIFLHIYNFFTLIALFFIARLLSKSDIAGFLTALIYSVFSTEPSMLGFAASTEMYILLPITLSLLFAILFIEKEKFHILLLSGVFAALAFWTKLTGLIIIFFIPIYCLQNSREKLKTALVWSSGFIFTTICIMGYFSLKGLFNEYIYWCFIHKYQYSKFINIEETAREASYILTSIFMGNPFIIIAAASGAVMSVLRNSKARALLLGFLFFSFLATLPGYAYKQYFAQTAPAIALAGGIGLFSLINRMKNNRLKIITLLCCLLMITIPPIYAYQGYYINFSPDEISRTFFAASPFTESVDIARFIKERTDKDDRIFILGSEAQIFLYSERRSATAFAFVYPLMGNYPRHREFQERAWREVEKSCPKYIILSNIPYSIMYDHRADSWLYEKTIELVKDRYIPEAVMTVEDPKGRLLQVSNHEGINDILKSHRYVVQIHRLKDSL